MVEPSKDEKRCGAFQLRCYDKDECSVRIVTIQPGWISQSLLVVPLSIRNTFEKDFLMECSHCTEERFQKSVRF